MTQPNNQPLTDVGDLFFQFATEGDTLTGAYLGYQPITWPDGNPGRQHYMDTGAGVYKFTGTFNLDASLDMVEPGSYTEIEYKGAQPTRRGLNPVKLFAVRTATTRQLPAPAQQPELPGMPPQGVQQGQQRPVVMGGMPAHQAMPAYPAGSPGGNAAALRQANQQPPPADVPGLMPLEYLPNGVPVFGYTPDGTPLDAYGRIIPAGI